MTAPARQLPLLACLCSVVQAAEAAGRPLISFSYDGLAPAVRTINVCISGVGERRFDGPGCWERAAEWVAAATDNAAGPQGE